MKRSPIQSKAFVDCAGGLLGEGWRPDMASYHLSLRFSLFDSVYQNTWQAPFFPLTNKRKLGFAWEAQTKWNKRPHIVWPNIGKKELITRKTHKTSNSPEQLSKKTPKSYTKKTLCLSFLTSPPNKKAKTRPCGRLRALVPLDKRSPNLQTSGASNNTPRPAPANARDSAAPPADAEDGVPVKAKKEKKRWGRWMLSGFERALVFLFLFVLSFQRVSIYGFLMFSSFWRYFWGAFVRWILLTTFVPIPKPILYITSLGEGRLLQGQWIVDDPVSSRQSGDAPVAQEAGNGHLTKVLSSFGWPWEVDS